MLAYSEKEMASSYVCMQKYKSRYQNCAPLI
jgi:hypothetical protein